MNQRVKAKASITTLLVMAFASLVGTALATVLAIQFVVGRNAALDLFHSRGNVLVQLVVSHLREQLDPASAQLAFVAEVLAQPGGAIGDDRIADLLTGALAAAPQIQRVVFIRPNLHAVVVDRSSDGVAVFRPDFSIEPAVRAGVEAARARIGGVWGEMIFAPGLNGPAINRRHSVWRDGRFEGTMVALVGLRQISIQADRSGASEHGGSAFVLSGRDHVLAHRRLIDPFPGLSPARPLPRLDEIDDPVLAAMWDGAVATPMLGRTTNSHVVEARGARYLFLYETLGEFGDPPWIAGAYFPLGEIAMPLRNLALAGLAGFGVLLAAVVVAILLARRLAAPTRGFAREVAALADLDFSKARPLPGSRIRELDEQAQAFNRLLGALRWFEAYVPRNLVRRLARETAPPSSERILTVMFTDLMGFTSLSQGMAPAQVADLLNAHFARVIAAVEQSGGTVDKFMGDGVMAFWGAPDRLKGHARRALVCAAALESSVAGTGLRLRAGIHTGRVVVGNIGSDARMNYTIVGDAVNATQRIEQLGKDIMGPDERVCLLASEDTWEAADRPADWVRVGAFTLRGRDSPVAVYRYAPVRADVP